MNSQPMSKLQAQCSLKASMIPENAVSTCHRKVRQNWLAVH